jgi:hypothetical protein
MTVDPGFVSVQVTWRGTEGRSIISDNALDILEEKEE